MKVWGTRVTGAAALRIVGLVFLGLGLLALAIAAVSAGIEVSGRHTARAEGTVVSVAHRRPWIRFKTPDGRAIGFRGSVRSSSWKVGDHAAVVFDPRDPLDSTVDGIAGRWFLPFLFGLLGGIFAIVGAGLRLAGRRRH